MFTNAGALALFGAVDSMKSYFPAYAQLTILALVASMLVGLNLVRCENNYSIDLLLLGMSSFFVLILCLLGKRAEGGLVVAVVLGWTWIFTFFGNVVSGGSSPLYGGIVSETMRIVPITSFAVYVYIKGIEGIVPIFWPHYGREKEEVKEENSVISEVDRMKPYFPRYAQLTFMALVVLTVLTLKFVGCERYDARVILILTMSPLILLALCLLGKRAEGGLLAAIILEWSIIFTFLENVSCGIFDVQCSLLFGILKWVPFYMLVISICMKSKRYFLFPFDDMMEIKR